MHWPLSVRRTNAASSVWPVQTQAIHAPTAIRRVVVPGSRTDYRASSLAGRFTLGACLACA